MFFCNLSSFGQYKKTQKIPANAAAIAYYGRTINTPNGEVTFDWPGTYFEFVLTGESCWIKASDKGESFYNVFVDHKLTQEIRIAGKDTVINIAAKLARNKKHLIRVQRRSEAEFGCTTIQNIMVDATSRVEANPEKRKRFIEFIGDSYTVGYGTDGKDRNEPFSVKTENADKTYACILSRYFNADYALIAHSGRGAVRNYGDSVTTSKHTMRDYMRYTLDSDPSTIYTFTQYKPDLVVVKLGINDFSTQPQPSQKEFTDAYKRIIAQVREGYGPDVPILCVAPAVTGPVKPYIDSVLVDLNDPHLFATASLQGVMNFDSDLGAGWHPGFSGHQKMALFITPYVSTITGWPLVDKAVK